MQIIFEGQILPVEPVLLIADFPHRFADHGLDFFLGAGGPVAVGIDHALAADLACQHHPVRRGQRFASHPRFRILGQEQIDNGIGYLVGDLVGMALGDRFGGEDKF